MSVCGFGAGKPALPRSFSTLDRAETVPVACPSERRTRVIRGHSRAKPIPADLHRRRSAEPPPEPSKLVMRVRFPSPALSLPGWSETFFGVRLHAMYGVFRLGAASGLLRR